MARRLRRSCLSLAAALLALASSLPEAARAVTPDEILPDKALETRARDISAGLRCLVCQNQSIDDSDAPLAHDLRVLVRERLKTGDTDQQVRDYIVARYGEFVLLKPPFNAETAILWLMPLLVLVGAALFVWRSAVAGGQPQAVPLSPDEQAALDALMRDDDARQGSGASGARPPPG